MASKGKSDVKVLKGQEGAPLLSVLSTNNPTYILSRTKAENKVLDYVKRVRSWQSNARHSTFPSSSPPLDKPPIRRRGHLRQPERCRPQNGHAEDSPRARRKGRSLAKNIRYTLLSLAFLIISPYICGKFDQERPRFLSRTREI
jgi:hypothetical protein